MAKTKLGKALFHGKLVEGGVVDKTEMWEYAAGIAGQNASYGLVSGWLFYFCTDVIYIAPLLVGIITSVARVFDGLNDPVAGVIMDRIRFKNGEKLRPYLLFTPVIIGLCCALMFFDWGFTSDNQKFAYILIVYLLWDMAYTFQDIAQWGMTSVISPITKERASVSQWARIGGSVGGWLPGLISVIIGLNESLAITSEKNLFIGFGIVMGFGGMMVSMLTHKAQERVVSVKTKEPILKSFGLLLKNRTVMLILLANLVQACTLTVPAIYFFKYNVSVDIFGITVNGTTFSFIFGLVAGAPGMLAMLFATKIAKLLGGMKNLLIVASTTNIATRVLAFFIGFEGSKIWIIMIIMGVASIFTALMGIASTALWGDSIDYMELKTGQRGEAVTFAAQNLIAKATSGLSMLFSGVTLTLLKYDSRLFEAGLPQGDTFNALIWPVYILAPALGSLFYVIVVCFVKYNKKMQTEVELALREKRESEESLVVLEKGAESAFDAEVLQEAREVNIDASKYAGRKKARVVQRPTAVDVPTQNVDDLMKDFASDDIGDLFDL